MIPLNPFGYNIWGGNVINASKTKTDRYYLTINGQSDHNTSEFKLVISSSSPIDTGMYVSDVFSPQTNRLHSLYFKTSETSIFNFNLGYTTAYCYITVIDAKKVRGTLTVLRAGVDVKQRGSFTGKFY